MLTLAAMPAMAQQITNNNGLKTMPKVINRFGKMVDMPVYGTPEADEIARKRCGTFMQQEMEESQAKGHSNVIAKSAQYVPHTGTVTIPVILVNFKDVQFTVNNPRAAFEQFFNGTTQTEMGNANSYNNGSVAKYFSDMSSGNFTPVFKVYGPVTLDSLESYYGGSDAYGGGERPEAMIRHAIDKLQATADNITDATQFCTDGNTIDCIYILYAGLAQNDGGVNTSVWAKTGSTNATIAGKSARWYSMAGELSPWQTSEDSVRGITQGMPMIAGVGTTCHEFSHALGLPDFYPTNGNAYIDNQEMEYWDLMDGGEYSGNGFCPTAYTAFEKNEMEWPVNIEELTESRTVTMDTPTEDGGTAYKIVNPNNSSEYIMLEYIRRTGWNRRQYGNGLMVYHVNRPSGDITSMTRFNNTPEYPGMAIVPADGACLSSYIDSNRPDYVTSLRGDLFPGTGNQDPDTQNVTELSDSKPQPNYCFYNSGMTQKTATNKALRNIRYDSNIGLVSFNYINDVASAIRNISIDTSTDDRIYTIDGRFVGNDISVLPHGIYIKGGKKVVK